MEIPDGKVDLKKKKRVDLRWFGHMTRRKEDYVRFSRRVLRMVEDCERIRERSNAGKGCRERKLVFTCKMAKTFKGIPSKRKRIPSRMITNPMRRMITR